MWNSLRRLTETLDANFAESDRSLRGIASTIDREYRESCRVVLVLTGRHELLDGTTWLKESIRLRNQFVDPLTQCADTRPPVP